MFKIMFSTVIRSEIETPERLGGCITPKNRLVEYEISDSKNDMDEAAVDRGGLGPSDVAGLFVDELKKFTGQAQNIVTVEE